MDFDYEKLFSNMRDAATALEAWHRADHKHFIGTKAKGAADGHGTVTARRVAAAAQNLLNRARNLVVV